MGRPRTYDRDEVLQKSIRLFWERGYEGTHLRDLLEATGINRFSLYKEFGGKEGLFEEALRAYIANLHELLGILRREPLGLANVRDLFKAVDEHPFLHGCLVLNTIREKHLVGPAAWDVTVEFVRSGEKDILRNLEAARRDGDLDPSTDTASLARLLVAIDIGQLTYGIIAGTGGPAGIATPWLDRLLR